MFFFNALLGTVLAFLMVANLDYASADQMGSAGPIRSFHPQRCPAPYADWARGACDPEPVLASLAAPERSLARFKRACALVEIMRLPQAVAELDEAIADDPKNTGALILRARVSVGMDAVAMRRFASQAVTIVPDNADAKATLAFSLLGENDNAALAQVDAAIALDPDNVDARWIRAMALAKSNRLGEADDDLTHGLSVEPDDTRSRLLRAQLRLRLGKTSEASDDATEILKERESFEAFEVRATARFRSKDFAGAVDDYTKILGGPDSPARGFAIRSEFASVYLYRAIALTRLNKDEDAERDIDTVMKLGGQRSILQLQLFLRRHEIFGVPLDGKSSSATKEALKRCFHEDTCGFGIGLRT